jgi:hypothetical protein
MLLLLSKPSRCLPTAFPLIFRKPMFAPKGFHPFSTRHGKWFDPNLPNSFSHIANLEDKIKQLEEEME